MTGIFTVALIVVLALLLVSLFVSAMKRIAKAGQPRPDFETGWVAALGVIELLVYAGAVAAVIILMLGGGLS